MKPLFIAITKEGKEIIGNTDIFNPGWKYIPEGLKKVSFLLPNGEYLCLDNYDSYLYLVEGTTDLNGSNKGHVRVEKLRYFGRRGNVVEEFIASRLSNKIDKQTHNWETICNKYRGWK